VDFLYILKGKITPIAKVGVFFLFFLLYENGRRLLFQPENNQFSTSANYTTLLNPT